MTRSTRLRARTERRVNYATGSRADPIILGTPEPESHVEPPPPPQAPPEDAMDTPARDLRRAPPRTRSSAVAKAKIPASKEPTHKVVKKKVQPKPTILPKKTECSICAASKVTTNSFKMIAEPDACEHFKGICKLCISNMVKSKVSDRQLDHAELDCPFPDCDHALSIDMLKLNMSEAAYVQYDAALTRHFLANDTSYIACLSAECGKHFCIADCTPKGKGKARKDSKIMAECPYCDYRICLTCTRPWESHGSKGCAEVKEQEEKDSKKALKSLGVKPCPGCGLNIQKNGGCDHMTCQHCKHNFCWECLVPYSGNVQHADHCSHGRINAADDPRNWANDNLNLDQIGRIIDQNLAQPGNANVHQAPALPQGPGIGRAILLPNMFEHARDWLMAGLTPVFPTQRQQPQPGDRPQAPLHVGHAHLPAVPAQRRLNAEVPGGRPRDNPGQELDALLENQRRNARPLRAPQMNRLRGQADVQPRGDQRRAVVPGRAGVPPAGARQQAASVTLGQQLEDSDASSVADSDYDADVERSMLTLRRALNAGPGNA